jgi:hypothetical protein
VPAGRLGRVIPLMEKFSDEVAADARQQEGSFPNAQALLGAPFRDRPAKKKRSDRCGRCAHAKGFDY